MPCRDYYDDHPEAYFGPKLSSAEAEIEKLKMQISFAESALCAVLKALESVVAPPNSGISHSSIFRWINFEEAGITEKQLVAWQKKHQALDEKHRAQEKAKLEAEEKKKRKQRLAEDAKKKLSAEEMDALKWLLTKKD